MVDPSSATVLSGQLVRVAVPNVTLVAVAGVIAAAVGAAVVAKIRVRALALVVKVGSLLTISSETCREKVKTCLF